MGSADMSIASRLPRPLFAGVSRSPFLQSLTISATVLALTTFAGAAESPKDTQTSSAIDVRVDNGLLELDVKEARLSDVLRAVAKEARIELSLRGNLDRPISRSFAGVPINRALRLLIGRTPHIIIQRSDQNETESSRLVELRVFGQGQGQSGLKRIDAREEKPPKAPKAPAVEPKAPSEEQILAQLKEPNRARRFQAIGLTTKIDGETAGRILQQVVADDENPAVRAYAIRTLTGLGSQMSLPALEEGLLDQDRAVRLEAIRAIARIDDDRAARSLERLIFDDPDPHIRRFAVQAIGLRRDESTRLILERAAQDPDAGVRKMVAHTLVKWQ